MKQKFAGLEGFARTLVLTALQQEARDAGDAAQVEICERALAGDEAAIQECGRVLDAAEAMRDD
jgi:hypothetical protein